MNTSGIVVLTLTSCVCAAVMALPRAITAAQIPDAPAASRTNQVPIDLPTVLKLAHAQNLDVQIAREKLAEARANAAAADWRFFPWISPGLSYRAHRNRIQDVGGSIFDADKQSYSPGATLNAEVDIGEAVYQRLAAKQRFRAAGENVKSQEEISAAGAAAGYFDLEAGFALETVSQDSLRIAQEYLAQIRQAVSAGLAFKGDELRVQSQMEIQQLALLQAEERQRVAGARLAEILQLDPAVELAPAAGGMVPLVVVDPKTGLDQLIAAALHQRPELSAGQAQAAAAEANKLGAKFGPAIPTVGAKAFIGGLGGGKDQQWDNFGESEEYFLGFSWRIGPGGLFDTTRIHAAEAQSKAAQLSVKKVRDQIIREVVEWHARAQSLAGQIGNAQQNVRTADQALKLSQERKDFAIGAVLEVVQSEQDLARAREQLVRLIVDHNKAQYELARALGSVQSSRAGAGVVPHGEPPDPFRK